MDDTGLALVSLALIPPLLWCVHRLRIKKIKQYKSEISGLIEVLEKYNGEKILTINKYHHGISINQKDFDKSYWYFIATTALQHLKKKSHPEVLFLGLGANASSGIIDRKDPKIHQTIVEIDKYIVEACQEFFDLEKMRNLTLIEADAYKLIDKRPDFKNKFDVIVVDIFTGIPPYVSTKTNQPPFIEKLNKWSKKDGLIIFNRPANIQSDREDTKKLAAYLKTKFKEVKTSYIRDPRGYQNDIISAVR